MTTYGSSRLYCVMVVIQPDYLLRRQRKLCRMCYENETRVCSRTPSSGYQSRRVLWHHLGSVLQCGRKWCHLCPRKKIIGGSNDSLRLFTFSDNRSFCNLRVVFLMTSNPFMAKMLVRV